MRIATRTKTVGMCVLIAAALLAVCGSAAASGAPSRASARASVAATTAGTLTVSTWGGSWTAAFTKYFAQPYTKATGVKFNYVVNGIDPDVPVLLQEEAGHVKIDIVDSGLGAELQHHGDLAAFPPSLLSLLRKTSTPGAANPYWWTYGTVPNMIVCNTHIVKRCPTTPAEFWNVKAYPGTRAMTNDPSEMAVMALEAAGVPRAQIASHPSLAIAQKMLAEIKPYVSVWTSSGSQEDEIMTSGQVGIQIMWESRVVPEVEGSYPYWKVSWVGAECESDYAFLVPKNAPGRDNGLQLPPVDRAAPAEPGRLQHRARYLHTGSLGDQVRTEEPAFVAAGVTPRRGLLLVVSAVGGDVRPAAGHVGVNGRLTSGQR